MQTSTIFVILVLRSTSLVSCGCWESISFSFNSSQKTDICFGLQINLKCHHFLALLMNHMYPTLSPQGTFLPILRVHLSRNLLAPAWHRNSHNSNPVGLCDKVETEQAKLRGNTKPAQPSAHMAWLMASVPRGGWVGLCWHSHKPNQALWVGLFWKRDENRSLNYLIS